MIFTRNGSPLSKLSLGGAALGSCEEKVFFGKVISDHQAIETIHEALDSGINLIDTSPFYGDSERKIGLAIREYGKRESFLLSTKAGTHPHLKGYSAEIILKSIENSLKQLKTDYLDVVHVHDPGIKDFDKLMEDGGGIETLSELRYQGVIRNIGLGVRDHQLHSKFIDSGFADVILPYLDYNLLSQTATTLLNHSAENNISVFLGSPLCMGLLSGKNPKELNISHFDIKNEVSVDKAFEMYEYCLKNDLNLMSLNFKFIKENPAISTVLVGPSTKEELGQNIQAFQEEVSIEKLNLFLENFSLHSIQHKITFK